MSILKRIQETLSAANPNRKTSRTAARFTPAAYARLCEMAEHLGTTKTEVLRVALENLYELIQEQKNNPK